MTLEDLQKPILMGRSIIAWINLSMGGLNAFIGFVNWNTSPEWLTAGSFFIAGFCFMNWLDNGFILSLFDICDKSKDNINRCLLLIKEQQRVIEVLIKNSKRKRK